MQVGSHYSDFKPVQRARKAMLEPQLEHSVDRDQSAYIVLCLKYEIFEKI